MAYTNFPQGITSFGIPVVGSGAIPVTSGSYWWVSSVTGNSGGPGTPDAPYATVAQAMAVAAANDVIIVGPSHAENITSATGLACSVAGVQVIGLGQGNARPNLTFTTANTATIAVSAANVGFSNMIFTANFLSIAACFTLSTARAFLCNGCLFQDTSSTLNFLNIVKSTGAANTIDGLTFTNNFVKNLGVTSNNTTILTANDVDRLTMINNDLKWAIQNNVSIGIIVTAGVLTNLDCGYNKGYRPNTTTAGGSLINVGGTTSTGWVYNNYVQTLTTSTDLLFTTSVGLAAFNNYVTGAVGASGFLIPAADS